jgi:thiol-disulfide isomerase/thioredoxin
MKKKLWFIFGVLMAFSARTAPINKIVYSEKSGQDILLGKVSRSDLQEEPFREWFNEGYSSYEVDQDVIDAIPITAIEELKITIVLATWCPDSRRELPRFLKILDLMGFPEENISFICVNREKKVPSMDLNYLDFERVPTFIFFLGGTEIGRIIESPDQSLEKDMAKIMTN